MKRTQISRLVHVPILTGALGVACIDPARAETDLGPARVTGEVEVGGRAMSGDFDASKFQEYQDFVPGAYTRGLVLIEDDALQHWLRSQIQYVGPRDQLYRVEGGAYGRWGFDAGYDEYPRTLSNTARTLYTAGPDATFTLPQGLQPRLQAIAAAPARSAALGQALQGAVEIPLGFEIEEGHAEGYWRPTTEAEGRIRYFTLQRSGNRPFSAAFGSPGGNFANFAAPVDDRIHDVRARLEWAEPEWSVAVDYDGSFYADALDSITVANPLRATDIATASSRGRLSAPPDNSANGISLTSAALVPVGFPLRIASTFAYQLRVQNADFLPETINTALTSPLLVLPRDSLHGQVNTWLGNVVLTGSPLHDLDMTIRYRVYEFDNTTGAFAFSSQVVNDQGFVPAPLETTPLDWLRQDFGFDAGYDLARDWKLDFDYAWQSWRRSSYRELRHQDDHVAGAHLEARPVAGVVLRTGYTWSGRRGGVYVPAPGELPGLRKFDEANRIENAVDALAQVTLAETLELSASGSYGYWNFESSDFGLMNSQYWNAGFDLSYHPFDWLGVSAYYTYESARDNQSSRYRPVVGGATIDLAANDWFSRFRSGVSTAGATADLTLWPGRVDLELDWLFETSQSQTSATGIAARAVDWPFDGDNLLSIGPTLSVHVTDHVTLRAGYRYERYRLDDFQIDTLQPYMPASNIPSPPAPASPPTPSQDVFLANRNQSYNVHVFGMSAQYRF